MKCPHPSQYTNARPSRYYCKPPSTGHPHSPCATPGTHTFVIYPIFPCGCCSGTARLWRRRQCDPSKRRELHTQRHSVTLLEGSKFWVKLIQKFKNFITYWLGGDSGDFGRRAKLYFRKMDCGYVKRIRICFSGGFLSYSAVVEYLEGHSALCWTPWKIVLFMPSFGLRTILLRDDISHFIMNPFRRKGFVWGCERNVKSW